MPGFSWENLPADLLRALARHVGIGGRDLPADLRRLYGARPTIEFVREARGVLQDRWLARDRSALSAVVDGTGVLAVPAGTAGRKGKGPDGRAHTREVKLGVVFTQTKLDDEGFPIRDPGSSRVESQQVGAPRGRTL